MSTKRGIVFAIATAFISGFAIFYNKLAAVKGIDPLIFNIVKNGPVAVILLVFILFSPKRKQFAKLNKNQWKKLLLIALVGGSIPFILFFQGLKSAPAINASIIHKTLFVWVAVMAIPLFGEKLNTKQIAGYLLVVLSNFALGGFKGFTFNKGEIMIFFATILWSIENIIAKITLKDTEAIFVAWGRMFFGTITLIIIAFSQNKLFLLTHLSFSQILPIAGSVILLTGYVLTWYNGLKLAPATIVSSVLILSTPITNILTAVFITGSFPQTKLIHTIFITIGISIIIFLSSKTGHKKTGIAIRRQTP